MSFQTISSINYGYTQNLVKNSSVKVKTGYKQEFKHFGSNLPLF
jgi:hypothetical protein